MLANSPDFGGVFHKSAHKRGGAYANSTQKLAFRALLGAFLAGPGAGLKSPGFGNKKVGKYA